MIEVTLKRELNNMLSALNIGDVPDITIEAPRQADHGDYATNVAFKLAPAFKKSPKQIAEQLVADWNSNYAAKMGLQASSLNGFINFKWTVGALQSKLVHFFDDEFKYAIAPKKILLEYVSANPTGPLHIGHGRWAVLGDVTARLLQVVGHEVSKEFYINDAGNQINILYDSVAAAREGKPIPENGYHGHYIKELAELDVDPVEYMVEHQQNVLASIDVEFDQWFSEKSLYADGRVDRGLQAVRDSGYGYDADGALWFRSTDFGDDKDRVLIKSDGSKTYFAVDVAYHYDKINRGYDKLINIWGADHHGYVARVKAALAALTDKDEDKLSIIIGQLVSLYRNGEQVRMSKRTGDMITLEDVIAEIGGDATRFFLIHKSADTQLDFDLGVATAQSSDNPVYYIQYGHARICSLLAKVEQELSIVPSSVKMLAFAEEIHPNEHQLAMHILRLPQEIELAATQLKPHTIANYVLELGRYFHSFYESCPIVSCEHDATRVWRIKLAYQTREAMQYCLSILGVSAPERM
ncbi:MAG: arginine--tRNA ligase [bacterium]|nr:arginine--tRNA ligase [bacterium]